MKKNILLIITLIILFLSFFNSWFSDYLNDTLTSFLYPFLVIIPLFISYIIILIFSIKKIIKNNRIIINYLPFAILIINAILILFFPFRMTKTKFELVLYKSERNTVIQMVKNGELKKDKIGNAELSDKYKKVSISGEIVIYQNNEEGTVIGFWVSRGILSGSVELIYSTGGEQLIKDNETGHPITSIEKLKENWYYVVTDY